VQIPAAREGWRLAARQGRGQNACVSRPTLIVCGAVICVLAGVGTAGEVAARLQRVTAAPASGAAVERLTRELEALRERWDIPGMTAAIASGDAVMWQRGFGTADRATGRPADAGTVYHLCSLTKPFAAVVLLQLVAEGRLSLDAPAAEFGSAVPAGVTVRHLLTHTSEGVPGERYAYSGRRFAELDRVIARVTGRSFATEVAARVLQPLALEDTAPNPLVPQACVDAGRDPAVVSRRLAQGYEPEGEDPVAYPARFLTAAGLVSTARDMARFSIALDSDRLLRAESRRLMFTAARDRVGRPLPYALGWFVQPRRPDRLAWHYGWWVGSSSLIVRIPERRLTFVLLANSDGLSRHFDLGKDDNVLRSPFARAFLNVADLLRPEAGGAR
jgi:CubicO group peptidase (beta-lactamase class C family)